MIVVVGPDRPPLLVADTDCAAVHVQHIGGDAMLAYAGSKGWLSDDGRTIRAHVETGA